MNLYELTNEYLALKSLLEDDEADEQIISDTLEAYLGADIENKAEGYAIVLKELEAELTKWQTEKKRIEAHVSTLSNNIDRMKSRFLDAMNAMQLPEIKTEHFNLKIAKNGGVAPLIFVDNAPIPEQFKKWEPNVKAIREAISVGEDVSSFAYLGERGVHLNIK